MGKKIKFADVFKNRNFVFLWLGQLFSQFGDRLNQMTAIALVTLIAPGSIPAMVKLLLAINIPGLIIAPFAGVFVDRWDRKKIMMIANVFQGLLIMFIPLLSFRTNSLVPIYIIIFLVYFLTTFFQPARASAVPSLVPKEQLLVANSLSNSAAMTSLIIGAALGDILISKIGINQGFYIDGIIYFVSVLMIFLIASSMLKHINENDQSPKSSALNINSVVRELKEAVQFILANKFVRYAATSIVILMSGAGALYVLFIVFIKINFQQIVGALGIVYAAAGFGLVLGSLIIGHIGHRIAKEKIILRGLNSVCLILFFFATTIPIKNSFPFGLSFAIIMFISLCLGIAVGPILVSVHTVLHEQLPIEMRGKVFNIQGASAMLFFIISMGIIGLITSAMRNFAVILIIVAASIIIFNFWNYRILIRAE